MVVVATDGDDRVRFDDAPALIDHLERFRYTFRRYIGQEAQMSRIDTKNRDAAITNGSSRAQKRAIASHRYG